MRKTSTLIYVYENLCNEENEIIDLSFDEFSDVLKDLNIKNLSPPESVVEKILKYAKDYIQ